MAGNMTLAGNSEFKSWVSQLKKDIRHAQVKAAIKVNTELLRLYWRMGADICEKQKSASWGDGWLKELSRELMAEFPDMKGLSYRNLQYIRQWYLFYNQGNIFSCKSSNFLFIFSSHSCLRFFSRRIAAKKVSLVNKISFAILSIF